MTDSVNVLERQENKQPRRSTILARAVVITAAALLGGCANVHHVEVGAIPDDYRTNHPIIVGEKETAIDVPVAAGEKKLNYGRTSIVRGFAAEYRENSSGPVQIMTPVGSPNSAAAIPAIRVRAPDFTLMGLDGLPHSLSDHLGSVVILAFFATW